MRSYSLEEIEKLMHCFIKNENGNTYINGYEFIDWLTDNPKKVKKVLEEKDLFESNGEKIRKVSK